MFIIDLEYLDLTGIDEQLQTHRNFLEEQYQKGLLLASGPKNPRTGGVIVALGNEREAVEAMIQEDPFFKLKLARYTITEFNPVKHRKEIADFI